MSNMDAFASNEVQVKRFADLSEQEILALAISSEEEDGRVVVEERRGDHAQDEDDQSKK